ncbi:MAG: SigE family RNA polymerase sigma factor [Acidimicrobiia bacterium]|nr:MAG: SigE family RNA polymerase sigma factor [Acidimicrobiia bacterium]
MTVRPRPRGPVEGFDVDEAEMPSSGVLRAKESFDRFYEREFRSVVGLAYALSGSRAASEDLAQEAFIAAHRNWDKVGSYDKPEAWVRRVVSNLSVSRFRKRASEIKALTRLAGFRSESAALPELPSEAVEFWSKVRKLPRRQAQVIALHYLEDRSVAEIADILECSQNTVKVHLHKGRQKLAERLGIQMGVEA